MKTTVLQQRAERDNLLSRPYQERYSQEKAILYRDSHPIKLITGPRRAGKSVLALQILKERNFAYLNFDDKKLLDAFTEDSIEQALLEVYPGYEFLLLDEVQNLPDWSVWVEKLYRRGVNLVITGSNANMLSSDLAAMLSGRFIEIRLFPFSIDEYMNFLDIPYDDATPEEVSAVQNSLSHYLTYGGYPEVIKSPAVTPGYVSTLYDSILLKDIVQRYKIRKVDQLYTVADWLLSNFANPFTANSMQEELGLLSTATVVKFTGYLQNTFLFQYLPRFNNKLQIMKKAEQKVYVIDNSFIMARAFELSENIGRLLENVVFLELIKREYDLKKYELFYYRSRNNKEVDFVCRRGVKVERLIQVCYRMDKPKTRKREIDSLIECAEELHNEHLAIITWDEEETLQQDGHTIEIVPLRKWIIRKS